ncbi:MAG: hypothetical protein GY757_56330 [bacterium]|nr:hypothetical protein [bacterium]
MKTRIFISLLISIIILSTWGYAASGTTPGLFFEPDEAGKRIKPPNKPWVMRYKAVAVDFSQLCQLETDGAEGRAHQNPLVLNLFDDIELEVRFYEVKEAYGGGFTAVGKIEGDEYSEVTFSVQGEILSGNIRTEGQYYQVRFLGEGKHVLLEIDQSQFPRELPPIAVALEPTADTAPIEADAAGSIDVLVVYTNDAMVAAGGTTAAMQAKINLAITESNTGYTNSGVTQALVLVHSEEVTYSEASFDWSDTLSRLRGTTDGYMDNVHTLRDTYAADEVVLLVGDTGYCGLAYLMTTVSSSFEASAFAVVSQSCATGYYSFAHELGHNMGSTHDRANASSAGAYSYSYGYQAPDRSFRTIMAYNCSGAGCDRVNYWSNPAVSYGGQPMGVSQLSAMSADNHLSLNNTDYTVANFRQRAVAPAITVTVPNGTESWRVSTNQNITWSTSGTVGPVKIEYSADNGTTWTTIVASTANDGSYTWKIPGNVSALCQVRISEAADDDPTDTSATFSIINPSSINVTSPDGGESLGAGTSHYITWNYTGSMSNVKIEYTTDNGATYSTVAASTTNDGVYNWTVPSTLSNLCLVRISDAADGDPANTSESVFSIESGSTSTVTITSPNGNESWYIGYEYNITWTSTGSIANVKLEYSRNSGNSWKTITTSTTNDGSYAWTVPGGISSNCLVRISDAADGLPWDISDVKFDMAEAPTITLLRPNGGEVWNVGSTYNITWISDAEVGDVKLEYSSNGGGTWRAIQASTANDGTYLWTVPDRESTNCLVKISEASDGIPYDTSNAAFTIYKPDPARILLDRNQFTYAATVNGNVSNGEKLFISNTGEVSLIWSATSNVSWLVLSPSTGINSGVVTVSADAVAVTGMAPGTYTGTISVRDSNADNSPQTATVTLTVYQNGSTAPPFGDFSTPAHGTATRGSVAVTGWALDDVGIANVAIYNGNTFIGDGALVEGARTDIQASYSNYPGSNRAGWGYMMLTNFLPNGGNGSYDLTVIITDKEGKLTNLGTKTITLDNDNAVKPFGAIDTPAQGGEASGTYSRNTGWVLTPMPNSIPTNGSTIGVYVDGVYVGHPNYNFYRQDIAALFPGYANTNGASGYLDIDTTIYANGVHTISWVAADTGGNSDGIGSRFFSIENIGGSSPDSAAAFKNRLGSSYMPPEAIMQLETDTENPVSVITGYDQNARSQLLYPGEKGIISLKTKALQRVVFAFPNSIGKDKSPNRLAAYRRVGSRLNQLPTGSTLDRRKGIFYWQPGPGFIGEYDFVFVKTTSKGETKKTMVRIIID